MFRLFLGKEAETKELAQSHDQFRWALDLDWSQSCGNLKKLATLPNYSETAVEP